MSSGEFTHLPNHIMEMPKEQFSFIPGVSTDVQCGCGFNAISPDPEVVREMFDGHDCFEPPSLGYAVQWHESLTRIITNLIGWSVIGFVLYTLLRGLT